MLSGATWLAAIVLALSSYYIPLDNSGSSELTVLKFTSNVPLMTHLLLGLPFYRTVSINVLCSAVYCAGALHSGMPAGELASCLCAVLIATIMASVLAYVSERSSRTHFLQEQLLGEIASRDGLTGLQNRASLDGHLERLWKQAQGTGEPIGLVLIDVDHFKAFNDTLGHQAGDDCLRQIAPILKMHARRPLDMAARYGGEEFAIVLFQTTSEQVRATGEAIRAAVEALGLPSPGSPRKVVTVSCGAAFVTAASGRSVHGLVQLADEALYDAKGSGRNCVRLAEQDYATLATGCFRNRKHLRVVG